mmetsp:Transcript_19684/g.54946  ORF Transcript_19684/g.54946 Transcript_19684/m.54946 type:complete len:107 (+) Transcript_19684:15-335(+)|eukprot:CAMPEP_0202359450 /NCGR_PEP_ID=MMETSP1126-20121109/12744_1 /ASSEMBLY_ACC=CAM_ASM_000457 /TAXON_ID=3047 /ORGANISM="Dunaliella tertiolecta, Strain CCMP1320" /LENGTH=106 /DNA_ID=CAMNT_0048952877 /DNA_START=20 /DNA_END=340 /DNA_ORIENTATION=+
MAQAMEEDVPDQFFGTTFQIDEEDHTLANSLRFFLNKNPHVSFCGYSMPHPSEELVNLRVQTSGRISASKALRTACEDLKDASNHTLSTFQKAVKAKRERDQKQQQ